MTQQPIVPPVQEIASILESGSFSGTTGTGNPSISIDLAPYLPALSAGRTMYVFLTYDRAESMRVVQPPDFQILERRSQTLSGSLRQSGILLTCPGGTEIEGGSLVLAMIGGNESTPPFSWRGVATIHSGVHVADSKMQYVQVAQTPGPSSASAVAVGYYGSTSTADLFYGENATPVVSVDQDGAAVRSLTWTTGGAEVTGGPWFTTTVATAIPVEVPPEGERPLPVDADTFWADRSCCECADVFLINNDALAERWDEPGSGALIAGDTLLLNHTDSDGTRWSLTDIEGWWTLPSMELPELKRAGYLDGSFPVDGRYGIREFTVSGVFIPGPGVNVAVPRQRLLRALDAIRGGGLFVAKEPVWAKQTWVYLSESPNITTKAMGTQLTQFEFRLRATDPIKYHAGTAGITNIALMHASEFLKGRTYSTEKTNSVYTDEAFLRGERFRYPIPTDGAPFDPTDTGKPPNPYRRYQDEVEGGNARVINAGTTAVSPRIYITGPCSNPVVSNLTTKQQMRFIGDIPQGLMLVVDCHWRLLVIREASKPPSYNPIADLEGTNRRWMLDFSSQWISIVPGENLLRLNASAWDASQGATATVSFRSGWLG